MSKTNPLDIAQKFSFSFKGVSSTQNFTTNTISDCITSAMRVDYRPEDSDLGLLSLSFEGDERFWCCMR